MRVFAKKEHTYICTCINTNKINATYGGNFEVKNTFSRAKTTSTVVTDKAHAGHKNNMHTGGKIEICTAEDKIIVVSINITKKKLKYEIIYIYISTLKMPHIVYT